MTLFSLRKASRDLGQNPRYLRGLIDGMRIEPKLIGKTLALDEKDIERLRGEIQRRRLLEPACR